MSACDPNLNSICDLVANTSCSVFDPRVVIERHAIDDKALDIYQAIRLRENSACRVREAAVPFSAQALNEGVVRSRCQPFRSVLVLMPI
jgi:hypothetical protein